MQQEILEKIWAISKPWFIWLLEFLKKIWNWILATIDQILPILKNAYTFIKEIFSTINASVEAKYATGKLLALDFFQKNRIISIVILLVTFLVLFFWISMLRHAGKNEENWKKPWLFVIFILGPIGAIIYYFGRKKALEKKEFERAKLSLKFFPSMNKKKD